MPIRPLHLATITLLLLTACSSTPVDPVYQPSTALSAYNQATFEDYVAVTKGWLEENRVFLSDNAELEIELNSPYELKPAVDSRKGVLLVHGLGDSPYSFTDVAKELQQQGFLVRTLLLPGHGSKPADLMLPELRDWQKVVSHHTALLAAEVDQLWLGGYSTGANLVTSEAYRNNDVEGLLLFSPAYTSSSQVVRFAPLANWFFDWADIDPETNITRYDSLPMNGAAIYYKTSQIARDDLETSFEKPVIMLLSEGDSVVDVNETAEIFQSSFTHPDSRLIWYGDNPPDIPRVQHYSMQLPEQKISAGSHMGLLFSPENKRYGIRGDIRICNNGQNEQQELDCFAGKEVWFSGWGYREENKSHARLTWNPYFQEFSQDLARFMDLTAEELGVTVSSENK